MERVKTLKREVKRDLSRRTLTKLKLDLSKAPYKNFLKICKYLAKDLKEVELPTEDPSSYLKSDLFEVSVEEVEGYTKQKMQYYFGENRRYHLVYKVTISDGYDEFVCYTIPGVEIKDKRCYTSRFYNIEEGKGVTTKVLDIGYIYGFLRVLDQAYDFFCSNKELFTSKEFSKISVFDKSYIVEDISYLSSISHVTTYPELNVMKMIIDIIVLNHLKDKNIELMDKYNSDMEHECARAFETKKNIPQKVKNVMNTTKLLKDFKFVEIDQDVDLGKFNSIEKEWSFIKKKLSLEEFKKLDVELRFKKLGKHRALGIYFPGIRCICVDIKSPSSFVHEFGHYIDYTYTDKQLSMKVDFIPIIIEYKKLYEDMILNMDEESSCKNYLIRKRDYFFTPTEIFARTLEMYLIKKGINTSFLKTENELIPDAGYPPANNYFLELINSYFDKLIKINEDVNEKEEITVEKTIIEAIKYSSLEQISFSI
ncbi:MAG: hypothetical protein ACLS2V_12820 [Clostridium paraputrificum]|uniref:hypothetical protein n=1 Tax=Clostridium sp. TaxID=1506 RepID=UPI0025C5D228|nr:hypothetical protein [Clostridium sp.]MBS5926247.1 hypothetical protein [Clostridium sp.]